jgi:hypothetical protein
MYPKRWETLVAARDTVDIVEIATWNGRSEFL